MDDMTLFWCFVALIVGAGMMLPFFDEEDR